MTELQAPCLCGGLIVAGASWAIADAVVRHNATLGHRAWRKRREQAEANARWRRRIRTDLENQRIARDIAREWGWAS